MAAGKLIHQQYGKAKVRVLKVIRQGARHDIKEVEVAVALQGDFDTSYTHGDNSQVVPTDTMKNIVNGLAQDHLGDELETFALTLAKHFLANYPQVTRASVDVLQQSWRRMQIDGQAHAHSFTGGDSGKLFARAQASRDSVEVEAGIEELLILKLTGSGFEGYPKDAFTTLPETSDRILATKMKATWAYQNVPANYTQSNERILAAMLKVFAVNYSPSVQTTLYQMAEAALETAPEISQVTLVLPNQHCLLVNLKPFGRENKNEIFVPTTEPHGLIEATVRRV